jgi:uncharacterized membrane protein YhiD involved in acid resistance
MPQQFLHHFDILAIGLQQGGKGAPERMPADVLDNDPSARGRIVSYVFSGVGFLGASVIFKDGANVRGLNTAATIWCSAAIGALCGLGALHLALVLAAGVLLTNMVLRPLAYRLHPVLPEAIPAETFYELKLDCKVSAAAHIRALLLSTSTSLGASCPLSNFAASAGDKVRELIADITVEIAMVTANCL